MLNINRDFTEESQRYVLEDCKQNLPENASLLETCGRYNVDFVICGVLPLGWDDQYLNKKSANSFISHLTGGTMSTASVSTRVAATPRFLRRFDR